MNIFQHLLLTYNNNSNSVVTPISSAFPSAVFDLDATSSASYSGGQVWKNLISSPADGSSQTAYDFNRGGSSSSSTDDPTFVGTPGTKQAYWLLDGGDYFTLANSVSNATLSKYKCLPCLYNFLYCSDNKSFSISDLSDFDKFSIILIYEAFSSSKV